MKIAILGKGRIGTGLGSAWGTRHEVVYGVRDPSAADERSFGGASKDADVVVFAIPYGALDAVLDDAGDLSGKVVIDCTNPVAKGMTLAVGHTTSAAEELQKRLPDARVFKSFNAQGAENLAAPTYDGRPASNFFCGDDEDAREVVRQLVAEVGFDPVDAGPLKNARLLEPLMILWVTCAGALNTREFAFRLLRR
ncbi:MAG: NAD(P)-binding domain-containing protein [Myxococcota bacterium]